MQQKYNELALKFFRIGALEHFPQKQQPNAGQDRLILEVFGSHTWL
jgi:hypothetical protein